MMDREGADKLSSILETMGRQRPFLSNESGHEGKLVRCLMSSQVWTCVQ